MKTPTQTTSINGSKLPQLKDIPGGSICEVKGDGPDEYEMICVWPITDVEGNRYSYSALGPSWSSGARRAKVLISGLTTEQCRWVMAQAGDSASCADAHPLILKRIKALQAGKASNN